MKVSDGDNYQPIGEVGIILDGLIDISWAVLPFSHCMQ
jgi:hypothetical protein